MDPELKRRIQELIDYKGGGFNQESVADIIENALKILTDIEGQRRRAGDPDGAAGIALCLQAVRALARARKVTIFGSARTQPTKMEYQQA